MIIHSKFLQGRTFISELFMYLPWIALTVLGYNYWKNLLMPAILICIWKCIGYFWNAVLATVRLHWLLRLLKIVVLVDFILYFLTSCELYVIGNVLCYSLTDLLFRRYSNSKTGNKYVKLLGMIVVGILLNSVNLFLFLLTLIAQIQLQAILPSEKVIVDYSPTVTTEKDNRYLLIEFFHNFLYYLVFSFIPLMGLFCFDIPSPLSAAVFCAANWVLFIAKDRLIELIHILCKVSQFGIIAIGFFVSAIIFVCIGLTSNACVILFLLFIQGASGGVSEAFWSQKFHNYESPIYAYYWKIGGIMGCLVGGIMATYCGIRSVCILSGIVSAVISIMIVLFSSQGGATCR